MITEETGLLSRQFCSDIDTILSNYWRGYYSDALEHCNSFLGDHGGDLAHWERTFIQSVELYLKTWGQDSACLHFVRALENSVQREGTELQWIRFYQQLLYTWLGCQERSNFECLVNARSHADEAANMLSRMKRDTVTTYTKQIEQYKFLPKPWCVFWFRALIRNSLSDHDGARKDFERAHRELRYLSENQYGKEPYGSTARLQRIRDYCHENALLAGRFYGDMGMFLFERGDMRSAKEVIELAVNTCRPVEGNDSVTFDTTYIKREGIDPQNAYVWSNLGFVLYSFKREHEALDALLEGYRLVEEQDNEKKHFYASGRIYYFLGAFAYRWSQRETFPLDKDVNKVVTKKITRLPINEQKIFTEKVGMFEPLFKAFKYYLKAKDLARALPALIIVSNPLSSSTSSDQIILGARRLLWEYSYGMGDFLASLTRYQRMTDQYLLRGLLPHNEEDY